MAIIPVGIIDFRSDANFDVCFEKATGNQSHCDFVFDIYFSKNTAAFFQC